VFSVFRSDPHAALVALLLCPCAPERNALRSIFEIRYITDLAQRVHKLHNCNSSNGRRRARGTAFGARSAAQETTAYARRGLGPPSPATIRSRDAQLCLRCAVRPDRSVMHGQEDKGKGTRIGRIPPAAARESRLYLRTCGQDSESYFGGRWRKHGRGLSLTQLE